MVLTRSVCIAKVLIRRSLISVVMVLTWCGNAQAYDPAVLQRPPQAEEKAYASKQTDDQSKYHRAT